MLGPNKPERVQPAASNEAPIGSEKNIQARHPPLDFLRLAITSIAKNP